jgi:hypothetical protein
MLRPDRGIEARPTFMAAVPFEHTLNPQDRLTRSAHALLGAVPAAQRERRRPFSSEHHPLGRARHRWAGSLGNQRVLIFTFTTEL